MKSVYQLLFVVPLSLAIMQGQQAIKPQNTGACAAVGTRNGPFRCPNGSSCGAYYSLNTEACNIDNAEFCTVLEPVSVCCNAYPNYQPSDPCIFAKMRDSRVRSRILELAEHTDILIPTCNGTYIPARIAFRAYQPRKDGGL